MRLCFGLGTRASQGLMPGFYLSLPGLRVEGNRASDIITHAQDEFDYIDLKEVSLSNRIDIALDHIITHHKMLFLLELSDGEMFYMLHGGIVSDIQKCGLL